jgi:hypothetical protein
MGSTPYVAYPLIKFQHLATISPYMWAHSLKLVENSAFFILKPCSMLVTQEKFNRWVESKSLMIYLAACVEGHLLSCTRTPKSVAFECTSTLEETRGTCGAPPTAALSVTINLLVLIRNQHASIRTSKVYALWPNLLMCFNKSFCPN